MIELTKAVPLPEPRIRHIYPYRAMEVGDSFYLPNVKMQIVLNNNYRSGKKLGMTFIARREKEGVRVWRVA
jgi:hypothetical protein